MRPGKGPCMLLRKLWDCPMASNQRARTKDSLLFVTKVLEEWGDKVDNVHFGSLMWGGNKKRTKPCKTMFRGVAITWNGKVGTCGIDMKQTMAFGDINKTENIMDIVNGKEAQKYRQKHIDRQFDGVCETCDSYYG